MQTRAAWILGATVLALTVAASAQVTVGDNITMNLNALASAGYTADYGSSIRSDHGLNFGGTGNLTGSYYTPTFLNFLVNPYYNQSRANSTSQSISDSSGVNASVFLFSGSRFPGSISYSKAYNSLGTFGAPGIPNFTSHGNSDAFSVGWGVNLENLPSLSFNYRQGHDNYSIYGTDASGNTGFRNFNANTNYRWNGFNLNGSYTRASNHSRYPILVSNEEETSDNHSNSFSVGASHDLPLQGSFSASYNRSSFNSDFSQINYSGTINTVVSNATFRPAARLTLSTTADFTDNLVGSLVQNIVTAGGVVQQQTPGEKSNSFDIMEVGSYNITQHILVTGTAERRQQTYFGKTYGSNSFTGAGSYWNHLFGGTMSCVLSVTRTMIDNTGQTSTGLLSTLNYQRRFGRWEVSGSGNYYQSTQTLLVGYTTSGFGYTAALGRKVGFLRWNASAGGSRSLLNTSAGYSSRTQNYTTGITAKWLGVTGTYAKSDGTALLGGNGPVPTPIPNSIPLPSDLILYGGHSYGVGLGLNPTKHFTATASYSRAFSNTMNMAVGSDNNSENAVVRLQYQFRQMWFTAGYSKFVQGFSASGTPPADINSYYFGVQRWFNFF
jgi:hypothetical protein